jgi:secreted trypsin-like serine protease
MTVRPRLRVAAVLAVLAALVGAVLLASPSVAAVPERLPAITGGSATPIATDPWDVALIQRGTLCSGSLIAPTWVITAAHCMNGVQASDISAYVGLTVLSQRGPATQVAVSGVFVHPQWDPSTYANDLALIQLQVPVAQSANAKVIPLPDSADPATWPAKGTPAIISGWGSTTATGAASDQLQTATVQVLGGPADTICGRYGSSFSNARSICAGMPTGGIDTCQGDSGSGLVIALGSTPSLAGVTSAGEGCAQADYPGIYTRITTYLPWIHQYIPAAVAPAPPASVTAQAISQGRAVVAWTTASPQTTYTVTTTPAAQTCSSTGTPACLIQGLVPGQTYSVAVAPAGGTLVGQSSPFVAVAGAGRVGVRVPAKQVASWARLSGRGAITMTVTPESAASCHVIGKKLQLDAPGLCVVQVRVGNKPGTAFIGVNR